MRKKNAFNSRVSRNTEMLVNEKITELAKTDPDRFIEENMDEIDKLIQEADAAGYELDADAMIEAIASGEYKDFDAIRATLK